MYVYETVVILNPYEYEESKKHIEDLCSKFRLLKKDELGVKKLAYPLRDGKFTEGFYVVFTWVGELGYVAELERNLRIDDNVLKFITVRQEDEYHDEEDVPEYPDDVKSEQVSKPDALDVLLGFADYKKKEVS